MQTRGQANIIFPDFSSLQGIADEALFLDKLEQAGGAILRAYGSNHATPDTTFVQRVALLKTRNIPSGAYYFATPTTPIDQGGDVECNAQCDQFLTTLQSAYGAGNFGEFTPFLDIESWGATTPQAPMYFGMNGTKILGWVKHFRDRFNAASGRKLGIYCGRWFMQQAPYPSEGIAMTNEQLAELSDMPLWFAEYDLYNANQIDDSWVVPNFGAWTQFVAWQFNVPAEADLWGMSHEQNYIDLNRTSSLSLLTGTQQPNEEMSVGSMAIVAMGTKLRKGEAVIAGLTSISGLELSADTIDTTTLETTGNYRTFVSTFKDAGEVSISGYFDPTAHLSLLEDFESGDVGAYTIEFPDIATTSGTRWAFNGVVTGYTTGAELEDLVSFEATIKVSGQPSLTAPV